jgi:hypothetical protein
VTVLSPEVEADESTYFAVNPDSRSAVAGCLERIRRYREAMKVSGRGDKMRRNWYAWQGAGPRRDADASRMLSSGEQGEMLSINVNHFASLVNQAVVLTTGQKPAIKAVPTSSDFDSLAQAQFADALNDALERTLLTPQKEAEAALTMVLMSEVAIVQDWDARAGRDVMPDESGGMVREGDVRLYVLTPFDYATDPDIQDAQSHRWLLWRRRANKWELAADHPQHRDAILGMSCRTDAAAASSIDGEMYELRRRDATRAESRTDEVYLWELRHLPTSACPNGRLVRFLSQDIVLYDSMGRPADAPPDSPPMDFGYPFQSEDGDASLMAIIASPEQIPGIPDGHTAFFDLLSLQEGVDLAASIIASAVNSGGMQNIYVPRGANISADKLTGALNVIEYDAAGGIPTAQDNVSLSPAVVEMAERWVTWMRQRVAMNDVVTGEPSRGMPAQAMALLRAQAVEFHSRLQAAYESMVERNRSNILKLFQLFARTERVAVIVGKGNAWASKSFSRASLGKVSRYACEPVNPATKTLAGRVAMAQPLLEAGKLTMDAYLRVVATGRDEPVLDFTRNNSARIQQEKEMLMRGVGIPPVAMGPMGPMLDASGLPVLMDDGAEHIRPLITDTHWLDIPEALSVLATPSARERPEVTRAVSEYVHLKLAMWRQMDPAIILLLGGTPAPMPMEPVSPLLPGAGSGTPTLGSGEAGPGAAPQPEEQPRLPEPPKNPITGERDLSTNATPNLPQS